MVEGGLFVTLGDKESLKMYLEHGIFSQRMPPEDGQSRPHYTHYRALADYSCAREGNHVFFFREREIFYGGQIVGSDEHGAFYLNGKRSPLGREAYAPLVWDESERDQYEMVERGLFELDGDDSDEERYCHPYMLRFEDNRNLRGTYITSDQLYFELGEYPYPLPSNTISGMGFCTITPGETEILLRFLEDEPAGTIESVSQVSIQLEGEPIPFTPDLGAQSPEDANPESHLEAAVTGNPSLLPEELQPDSSAICRQVPISPFKPKNMDEADVCYFTEDPINDGTIPNTVIELKNTRAGKAAATQVVRYLRWLHKRLGETAEEIDIFLFAPSYTGNFNEHIPAEYAEQIQKVDFAGSRQQTLGQ